MPGSKNPWHIAGMNFIATLYAGMPAALMGRARSLPQVSLAGLTFAWNGRQYSTGLLTDIPSGAQNDPNIQVATVGVAPVEALAALTPDPAVVAEIASIKALEETAPADALPALQAAEAQLVVVETAPKAQAKKAK